MARIIPFRGWRYNIETVIDLHKKFSPLFDVVSPEQLSELYTVPNNSIFLSVPRTHDEALAKLSEWKEKQILKQEALPAIYPYYLKFSLFGQDEVLERKGFVCLVKLNRKGEKPSVVLHESTIQSSVYDRVALLEKTLLNVAPTHGFYDDPDFELEPILDAFMQEPVIQTVDYQGILNKFSILQNRKIIQKIQRFIEPQQIILADGHHRLESSYQIRDAFYEKYPDADPDHLINYHLIYLTNIRAKDLRILPTHRLVKVNERFDIHDFFKVLGRWFEIEKASVRAYLPDEIKGKKYNFGLLYAQEQYILRLRKEISPLEESPLALPDAVKKLDYSVLHDLIIDRVLGIPYENQGKTDQIAYIKDYGLLNDRIQQEHALGFVVNDVQISEMLEVCHSGALMPMKSTFFYPKVLCGLVFASVDAAEDQSNTLF